MSNARRTAVLSLAAALVLTATKLGVGLATGSLGILAEAAHSALDAGAALVTVYAVGVAERPPDLHHQYGHGKAQYLSALAEAVLLSGAAVWIAVEAVIRLASNGHQVHATWYAFALLVSVLAVDAGRTVASLRLGRRERNQALIANAWHFGSDFLGTSAVLVGLGLVAAGVQGGDSVAAMFVAAIVLVAAVRLAASNVDALMDRAPSGLTAGVEQAVRSVPGVSELRSLRVREAGGQSFADVTIGVSRLESLERSHETMDRVESAVRERVGPSQVTVHVEPTVGGERANERVAAAALRVDGVVETHNITVLEDAEGRAITLHARLPERMPLSEAGRIVARLKQEIAREFGDVRVYVHVEPSALDPHPALDVGSDEPGLRTQAEAAVRSVAGDAESVVVYRQGGRLLVVTSVRAPPDVTVREAHTLASRVEDAVRDALDAVDDVIVEVH